MEITYVSQEDDSPICESQIYCHGDLLRTIQLGGHFKDSKSFVDKKLKKSPKEVVKAFEALVKESNEPDDDAVMKFIEENFDDEGLEIESCAPVDWIQVPPFCKDLKSPKLRGLSRRINRLWMNLNRKIVSDVSKHPELYSIIPVPNSFVVPGGRFREFYYWDTYWIIRSLLHCGMTITVKGMIENFCVMIEKYGLIPNGGRIYYIRRSQPPLLSLMLRDYMDATKDIGFLRCSIGSLIKEIKFWEESRCIKVKYAGHEYMMFRYGTKGSGPRPESFKEDYELAMDVPEEDRRRIYYELMAGAESGWDYSSRWFIDESGGLSANISDIHTSSIIPVDLNCFLYLCYRNLSHFHKLLGEPDKAKEAAVKAELLRLAIHIVLYDEEEKIWFDYNLKHKRPRKHYFLSNIAPIWAECYPPDVSPSMAGSNAIDYLKRVGALKFRGGIPTSLFNTGQQWDFPNAWPPLQHMLVVGLKNSGQRAWAQNLARLYTDATMFGCSEEGDACKIFEKYSVTEQGAAGGGGEYEVQEGFGWTNGVIIDFIVMFGDELLEDKSEFLEGAQNLKEDVIAVFDISAGKSRPLKSKAWEKIKNVYRAAVKKHHLHGNHSDHSSD
eukprot:TRINITY_DN2202_c0_g1_i1.p1 TRINITY_DN2202_c0_g1~~TRINITY_DN2202_c0_g1_i1.p1  ORF type:complete len:610 (-),score=156.36 TRINITY_DN2202_c0_g1_i1:484-2313(-)